jgi:MFS transporter, CP family, cyanate transporter
VVLFAMTLCMGTGISISQPTFPALVRQWFPRLIARATGFWSNGLLVGELLSASLTLPLVLPLVGSWQASFVVWSIPVFVTAALVAVFTPRVDTSLAARPPGMPDWRDGLMWRLGLFQAAASMVYFGANTFIPDYLHAINRPDTVGLALASLNALQLPATLVISVLPLGVLARPSTSYVSAAAIAVSLIVVLTLPGWPLVVAAGMFGFCAAYILVLSLAVPALRAKPTEVARMSAGTFAISYCTAFLVTLVAGAIWDASRIEASAFLPALLGAGIVAFIGPRILSADAG